MIYDWVTHPAGKGRRSNLEETDIFFNDMYEDLLQSKEFHSLVDPGELIFRVHHRILEEPLFEDYDDQINCHQLYELAHKEWREQYDSEKIDFDNHWISFTDSIESIKSNSFKEKGLRGLVIVMRPKKGIKIYKAMKELGIQGNIPNEREVVAPLDKENVVEILKYEDFLKKYDK